MKSDTPSCSKNPLARRKKTVRPRPVAGPFGRQHCCIVDLLSGKSTKAEAYMFFICAGLNPELTWVVIPCKQQSQRGFFDSLLSHPNPGLQPAQRYSIEIAGK
jgi:hypothetical protein